VRLSVSDVIIKFLEALDTRRVYGIIGTSVLDFVDALYGYRGIADFITARHEQAAVSMADGEARVSGKPGVALVHVDAGFLNAMLGLGIAWRDYSQVY
jgi:acetolactate synthase-1/2/3 large subunit